MSKKEHIWADKKFVNYLDYEKTYQKNQLKNINKWNELIYSRQQIIDNMISLKKTDIVLDIGCGDGEKLKKYDSQCLIIGIDISYTMCKKAKSNLLNGEVIIANMEYLPFKNASFSKVLAIYSLIYAPHKLKAMKEISRIMKNESEFLVYEQNKISLFTTLRFLQTMKYILFRENNPKALHHKIAIAQSLNYFSFKKLGNKTNLKVNFWCGQFYFHIIFNLINQEILINTLINTLNLLSYKQWGRIPLIKFFSDFLIIKFIKIK